MSEARTRDADVLFHRVEGDGPPVALLNGVSMTLAGWYPVHRALSESFRVVRCDFRGQLRTPGPPHVALGGHVEDLCRLLDHLGIERTHAVGTSFGAVIGLLLAERHPDRVGSLVLATVGPGKRSELLETARRWSDACAAVLAGEDRERFYREMARDLFSEATRRDHADRVERLGHQIRRLPTRWFRDLQELLSTAGSVDLAPLLPRIPHPALVVAAGEDVLVSTEDAARLAHGLPAGRLEVVPRAGHALVLERPQRLAELCLDFLDERAR